jgi:hypothetical protein
LDLPILNIITIQRIVREKSITILITTILDATATIKMLELVLDLTKQVSKPFDFCFKPSLAEHEYS